MTISTDPELEAALAHGDYAGHDNPAHVLAAEVRRLRAEVDRVHNLCAHTHDRLLRGAPDRYVLGKLQSGWGWPNV